MLPEELDAMADGMQAGHRAARAAIKSRRPDLPVGLSLAVVDDRVFGDDPSVRDRKRDDVYARWLRLAREDDFIGVQNYERAWYDAHGEVGADGGPAPEGLFSAVDTDSLAGAVAYTYAQTGVPIMVTEHGRATDDDTERAAFIEPSLSRLLDSIEEGVPVLGYCHWSLMDNYEWLFGYTVHLGLHAVDRETFRRIPKPSAHVYAAIVRSGLVDG